MIIAFELSMPGNNSWNGKWSGEGSCYAVVKNIGQSKKRVEKYMGLIGYHSCNFGDGWRAAVEVSEVSASEARKLRKQSRGFCGYEWMIDSLVHYGKILNDAQIKELLNKKAGDGIREVNNA